MVYLTSLHLLHLRRSSPSSNDHELRRLISDMETVAAYGSSLKIGFPLEISLRANKPLPFSGISSILYNAGFSVIWQPNFGWFHDLVPYLLDRPDPRPTCRCLHCEFFHMKITMLQLFGLLGLERVFRLRLLNRQGCSVITSKSAELLIESKSLTDLSSYIKNVEEKSLFVT